MEPNKIAPEQLAEIRAGVERDAARGWFFTHEATIPKMRRLLAHIEAQAAEIARLRARPNYLEEVLQLRRKTERFQREHDRLVRVVREQRAKIEGKPDKWLEAREREESELMSGGYEEK